MSVMKVFTKEWREEKWKDPVWSKVISTGIISLCGIVGTGALLVWKAIDPKAFKRFMSLVLEYLTGSLTFPIWFVLAAIGLIVLLFFLTRAAIRFPRKQQNKVAMRNPVWDEQVGKHSFEELYNLLATQRLRVQTNYMRLNGVAAPEETLLEQFLAFYDAFRKGIPYGEKMILRFMGEVEMNDGGYVPEVLAPKLMEYDLLVTSSLDHKVAGQDKVFTIITYNVSEVGYKFYDCLMIAFSRQPQAVHRAR